MGFTNGKLPLLRERKGKKKTKTEKKIIDFLKENLLHLRHNWGIENINKKLCFIFHPPTAS